MIPDDIRTALPEADRCVLRYMLERHAAARPNRTFVKFRPGESWTYAQTFANVRRRAAVLREAGVRQGDHVLCWMGNGPDLLTSWFAINYLGAVYVPINTAARGRPLEHILNNVDAQILVAHRGLLGRLSDIGTGTVKTVLLTGDSEDPTPGPTGLAVSDLREPETDPGDIPLDRPIAPWDTQAIMYTSGTTGPAKGVVSSYAQLYTMGPDAFDIIHEDDCCMIAGPIFHAGSTLYVYHMLDRGGTMAMIPEFRTGEFWDALRETGSTVVLLLGVMASFLLNAPPSDRDRDHPLKKVFITPFTEDALAFRERFGVDVFTIYNMTEISSPLVAGPNPTEIGICGKPKPWFELRVADAHDRPVPVGETGELLIRSHRPWALLKGYYRNPEATVESMRNGWFHTGDAFRMDEDGRYFFVDRIKDVIRRRGENISSVELEGELCVHPDVKEAVAVAVPSEHSEDEVLVAVVPVEGKTLDPAEIVMFLADRVAHYMIPRYVRIVSELPKTASGKPQKHEVRAEGITCDTWDREAAGVKLSRTRL